MDQTDFKTPNPCILTFEEQNNLLGLLRKVNIRLGNNRLPTSGSITSFNLGPDLQLTGGSILDTIQGIQTSSIPTFNGLNIGTKFVLNSNGLFTKINNTALAGEGIPLIVAYGSALAQTGNVASLTSFTTGAAGGAFEIGGCVDIISYTSGNLSFKVAYTDSNNIAQSATLMFLQDTFINGAVLTTGIKTNGTNTITLSISVDSFTGNFNAYGWIKQIA